MFPRSPVRMAFTGFPRDALRYFAELEVNNRIAWYEENKDRYQQNIREPSRASSTTNPPAPFIPPTPMAISSRSPSWFSLTM